MCMVYVAASKGPSGVCVCVCVYLGAIGFIFKDLTISHNIKAKPSTDGKYLRGHIRNRSAWTHSTVFREGSGLGRQ